MKPKAATAPLLDASLEATASNAFNETRASSSGGGESYRADVFDFAILFFAAVGVAVNAWALVVLVRKKSCSMFHKLMKVRKKSHSL